MSRLLPCTTLVCWTCMEWPRPGCPACVDGVDWTHVAVCDECAATMAEVAR